ncbi:MAG TPA: histidine kinase [Chitinophagaceae bacterium]|nr:histidine kinase [Chitinophagaceae bacterium]
MAYIRDAYFKLNKSDSALKYYNLAVDSMEKIGLVPNAIDGLKRAYLGKAGILSQQNNNKEALKFAKKSLVLNQQRLTKLDVLNAYELISKLFHQLRNNDSAYAYLVKHNELKESMLTRQFLFRLNNYKSEVNEAKKEARIGFLNRDNQIKEQQLKQEASLKKFLLIGLLLLFIAGVFIVRTLLLKRKNDKLKSMQLENELRLQQLENEKRQTEFQKKTTELEMQALRAQMNPHFIFNCLSSINRFILKNEPDTASDYLTRFSRLIRMVLLNSQKSLITLEDELDMLTIYLDMERLRFKNTFDYHIVFTNRVDAGAIYIPPLLLQPFCENAIWHGLKHLADPQSGRHEHGRLDIVLSMEDKVLNCSITDNGIGRQKAAEIKSKSAEEKKSLGLKITTERLALLNQEKENLTSFEIVDLGNERGEAAGTIVKLKISLTETVEEFA